MSKLRPFLLLLLLLFPLVALHAAQQTPEATEQAAPQSRLEITGVNASQMPNVTVTVNVYDQLGQPVPALTAADFAITGDLSGQVQISKVENITDDNLPFATVLAIDVSSSMAGTPLIDAKQAAHAYIANIGANDPVAILTFANQIKVAQAFTTDKDALNQVIDSLDVNGETPLYQGAYDAIDLAASSGTPRRAVILLSDGAEYGGISKVGRGAAVQEAIVRGVPVYTIGLGFGDVDRPYLQDLSGGTNAHFYESPDPNQLTPIFTALAAQLRSQYVLTLNAPLPLDGTQYNLQIQATTPDGSTVSATATLRSPIPVPIVDFSPIDGAITQPTDVTAQIKHDDPITSVSFQATGQQPVTLTAEPYTYTINPVDFAPGNYTLTANVTDSTGDTGTASTGFTVGALPSDIALSPDLASLGQIDAAQTVTVQATGQTSAASVTVDFNSSGKPTTLSAPFSFTLDPQQFQPGNNTVSVMVTNQGGVTSQKDFNFKVAALPPQVAISGLQDGQTVGQPLDFTVTTTSQTPVTQINASANEFVLTANSDGSYTLDPAKLPAGDNALVVQATTANQQFGQTQVNFVVPALPPTIIVNGLMAGEVLHEDRDITLDFIAQEPVIHVAFFVDGADLAHEVHTPYAITIKVLDYAPGAHILRLIADEANGQESTLDVPFTIAPEAAATATATTVFATQSALATATQEVALTAISVQGTQFAHSTATQVAQVSATAGAAAVQATATQVAQVNATAAQVAANNAQGTQSARATATEVAQATATQAAVIAANNAQGTQSARATATEVAQATATQAAVIAANNAQGTQSARATATEVAQATATQAAVVAANNAQATQSGQVTATQAAQNNQATATSAARATNLASNLATLQAQITGTAQSAQATQTSANATATQSVLDATATQAQVNATATQAAQSDQATATINAQATKSAQTTATQSALQTQLANNLATLNAAITATAVSAGTTATQQAALASANNVQATQRAFTNSTGTAVAQQSTQGSAKATGTQSARVTSTSIAQATANAASTQANINATATQSAAASATQNAVTAVAQNVQATQGAQSTMIAAAQAQMQAATRDTLATSNAQARLQAQATQSARATRNAQSTATQQINATATAAVASQQVNTLSTAILETATQLIREATATYAPYLTATAVQATQVAFDATSTAAGTSMQAALNNDQTQVAAQTLTALEATATKLVMDATSTRQMLETQAVLDATTTATVLAATDAQSTQIAVGTAVAQAQLTMTAQQFAGNLTATTYANGTATQVIGAAATSVQATSDQATLDTRLTAVGPTATPLTGGAQNALTQTPQPSPTLTEIQAQEPPITSNIAPIAIVLIVIIVIIIVLVLILRRPSPPPPPTSRR